MKCLLKDHRTGLCRPLAQALAKKEAAAEAHAGTGFLPGRFELGQAQGSGRLDKAQAAMSCLSSFWFCGRGEGASVN